MFDPSEADLTDPLAHFRKRFLIPQSKGKEQVYFLGNSLGLQPVSASSYIKEVLDQWATYGVEGFFIGDEPWIKYHVRLTNPLAAVTGALPSEIVVMNSLTVNLHLLLATFYKPSGRKFKIICEANAFPSDQYMLETHVRFHGLDPDKVIVEVSPREGEHLIRPDDIHDAIDFHADELSLVLWGGVNYYTGQVFDIRAITESAHKAGAIAGFDLAHAAGNIHLDLHNWNVDFACWCSYKYLNSGPGGIAGAYVHERYHHDPKLPRLGGWWGYNEETRFLMKKGFLPTQSAAGWQVSTPPLVLMALHNASLDIFAEAGIVNLVRKGQQLSDYLIELLKQINRASGGDVLQILTPSSSKGCQVSIVVKRNAKKVFDHLMENGIFADWREPSVIRVAPVPLYNTFGEVLRFSEVMKKLLS